jgi:uncharacterized HAD superfamily protein
MEKKYCQREIEEESKCDEQCDHCKEYYKPLVDEGLRYNESKIRHDLLEPYAINELAKVFTVGAEKYAPGNWEKGMNWTTVLASLKRHINAFEQGEDYDKGLSPELEEKYGKMYHMAHAAWNALALVSYYKIAPTFDDRRHSYLKPKRIGLDIDSVLADFHRQFCKYANIEYYEPTHWNDPEIEREYKLMKNNDEFWLTMPVLTPPKDIHFEPTCYITTRSINPELTKKWLDMNGYPSAEVYSILEHNGSKVEAAKKAGIDYFIDDKYENFIDLNKNGIFCLLMDASYNRRYDVGYKRIKNFEDFTKRFL